MAELPSWMLKGSKPRTPVAEDERLLSRFHPSALAGGKLAVDAVRMPDMSVMRETLCPDLDWVLFDPQESRDYSGWGIAGFLARDIPKNVNYNALSPYQFKAVHVPLDDNYPHAEVRAEKNGVHQARKDSLPPEVHIRFREMLVQVIDVVRQPKPDAA